MAERVELLVVAKDAATQVLRGVTSSFGQLGNMVTSLASGQGVLMLTEQIVNFGKQAVDATVKYGNEVRNLSMISGESAESSSRFLQVLDDYKISYEDALAATRAMTKEGLTPNLETLAKLSDEYLSITDKQKQNEFVIKNLGRAGLQWVDVLNKGSTAILAQGDAVAEGLILNQQQLDQIREMEIAQDVMNESWEQLSLTIGTKAIPVMTEMMDEFNFTTRAIEIMREKGLNPTLEMLVSGDGYINALKQAKQEAEAQRSTMLANAEAADTMTSAHEKTKEELKAEEEAAKALTEQYKGYLDLAANLFSNQKSYEEDLAGMMQERAKLQDEYNELSAEGWDKNEDALEKNIDAMKDLDEKIDETKKKHAEAMGQMQYDLLLTKLSVDGLTSAEFDMAQEAGIAFGVFDRESADAAIAMNKLTDKVAAGKISVYEYGEIMKRSMRDGKLDAAELQRIIAEIPEHTTSTIDVYTNYYYTSGVPGNIGSSSGGGRAGGGSVSAGMLYRVNETRTEYFKPSMSGTVLPLGGKDGGGGGDTFHITLAPTVMIGDRSRAANELQPIIYEAVRKAKADKII